MRALSDLDYASRSRVLGSIVAVVLLTATSCIAIGKSAEATPFGVHIKSQQFNMCSHSCGHHADSADWVIYAMADDGPFTVSLNEACLADVKHIAAVTNYSMAAWYTAKRSAANCPLTSLNGVTDRYFGNAAFAVGTSPGGYERAFPDGDQHDADLDNNERRGLACMWGTTYIGRLISCSAHLTNRDDSTAQAQSNDYSFIVAITSGTSGYGLRILGGDFNLTPSQLPAVWSTSYEHLSTGVTAYAPTPSTWIDFLHFLNPNYTNEASGPNIECPMVAKTPSDHCYVYGEWW